MAKICYLCRQNKLVDLGPSAFGQLNLGNKCMFKIKEYYGGTWGIFGYIK